MIFVSSFHALKHCFVFLPFYSWSIFFLFSMHISDELLLFFSISFQERHQTGVFSYLQFIPGRRLSLSAYSCCIYAYAYFLLLCVYRFLSYFIVFIFLLSLLFYLHSYFPIGILCITAGTGRFPRCGMKLRASLLKDVWDGAISPC